MSDLHQAVQAEIAAHTPALPPSFEALQARKRRRDRRRSAAAVVVTAVAVAGVALVPSALLGGGGDPAPDPAPVARDAGSTDAFGFHVKATGAADVPAEGGDALQRCLDLPGLSGTSALSSLPAQYTGRVSGRGNADSLSRCVEAVPGWGVALTPIASYTVQPARKLVGNPRLDEQRDACFALPGVQAVDVDGNAPPVYRVSVYGDERAADFEQCITAVIGLHVPELGPESEPSGLEWTGVTICRLAGQGEDDCQAFGEQEAQAVDAALAQAAPAPPGQVYCEAASPAYAVTLEHPTARSVPVTVRVGCGPTERGDQDLLLPVRSQRLVQQVHADAGTGASLQAFLRRCLAPMGELPAADPGFVGRTEQQVAESAETRVIGRDGACLDRTSDYRPERVDLVVLRDRVVWAGRP